MKFYNFVPKSSKLKDLEISCEICNENRDRPTSGRKHSRSETWPYRLHQDGISSSPDESYCSLSTNIHRLFPLSCELRIPIGHNVDDMFYCHSVKYRSTTRDSYCYVVNRSPGYWFYTVIN